MSAWPSSICTARRSAPWLSRCVAKAWRSVCGDSGAAMPAAQRVLLDELPEHLPRHRPAARGDEQRIARCAAEDRRRAPRRGSARSSACASSPNGTSRSLLPLPMTRSAPSSRLTLHGLQRDQLAHAQAARVHQLEHRAVAQAQRRVDVGRGEQRLDLRLAQRLGHAQRLAAPTAACSVGSASISRSRSAQRK